MGYFVNRLRLRVTDCRGNNNLLLLLHNSGEEVVGFSIVFQDMTPSWRGRFILGGVITYFTVLVAANICIYSIVCKSFVRNVL